MGSSSSGNLVVTAGFRSWRDFKFFFCGDAAFKLEFHEDRAFFLLYGMRRELLQLLRSID